MGTLQHSVGSIIMDVCKHTSVFMYKFAYIIFHGSSINRENCKKMDPLKTFRYIVLNNSVHTSVTGNPANGASPVANSRAAIPMLYVSDLNEYPERS